MKIKNENIPDNVKYIISTLEKEGFEAYIVGGCVRDMLLGTKPKDYDITTSAKPETVISLFHKVIPTGIKHGTVTVCLNNENYEVTTFRSEGNYKDGRHPDKVEFISNLKEDLARRDFTINAMAFNEKEGLKDYFHGLEDLNNKIIRTVGKADERFKEDALRMLRAIRFSAQLDFKINDDTLKSIKKLSHNINFISKERIREEFNKILIYNPEKINVLKECEILPLIIKNIEIIYDFDQNNKHHSYNLYDHTLISIKNINADLCLRLTMLLHDIGKTDTKTTDKNGVSHYYNHPKYSAQRAEAVLKDLKYDNKTVQKVVTLIKYHDEDVSTKVKIKKLLNKIGTENFEELISVKKADLYAKNNEYIESGMNNIKQAEKWCKEIIEGNECYSIKQMKITGNDIASFGVKGKEIGIVLQLLLDKIIEEPSINNHEKLEDILGTYMNNGII